MDLQYNWVEWPEAELLPLENFYAAKSNKWLLYGLVILVLIALAYFIFKNQESKDEAYR